MLGEKKDEAKKESELAIFDQLEEALEEREGSDRRKVNLGKDTHGNDRRKGDRRRT